MFRSTRAGEPQREPADADRPERASRAALLKDHRLLIFATCAALFQFANALRNVRASFCRSRVSPSTLCPATALGAGQKGSVLSALFAVSTVLAVLCGGRARRRRRDDRNRAILGAHGNAALLLWLLDSPISLLRPITRRDITRRRRQLTRRPPATHLNRLTSDQEAHIARQLNRQELNRLQAAPINLPPLRY